jgi:two-component system response regulator RegA
MTTDAPRTLLLVEDDEILRARLARAFRDRGLVVTESDSAEAAIEAAREDSPELAVVDLRLPRASGLEVVRELATLDPTTVVVVLTGYGSIATALEATRLGARRYLTKPADADQILAALDGQSAADVSLGDVPSLARVEWEHIQRVLHDCNGNISQAARLLGLHRRSLQRKLLKHPLPR